METFNTTEEMGWDKVKEEFDINTRYFDNIKVYPTYSYKVPHKFEDASLILSTWMQNTITILNKRFRFIST